MKKIIFFIIVFLSFNIALNASCTYSELKERNTLASYVNYSYDFNEGEQDFTVTIYNLNENLKVKYGNDVLSVSNKETKIYHVVPGTVFKADIISDDDCNKNKLRIIKINIPYLNPYYGRSECEGHEDLKACSSKYLDYELSETAFINLINGNEGRKIDNNNNNEEETDETVLDKLLAFLTKIYVPVILVILSGLIATLIFRPMLRKAKHGI